MEKGQIRCFISLDLSREAINYIEDIQKLIKKKNFFNGKFIESENLHLTLKFLGEISEDKLEKAKKELRKIKFKEFEAELGEAGLFSERALRIVWIKLLGKQVFELQKHIDIALKNLFEPEYRFMSHITIARIKNVLDKKRFLEYIKNIKTKKISFKVKEFVLRKSELTEKGPNYQDIEKSSLES